MKNIPRYPFYFIRHGETDWNLQHKIMGKQDIPLNHTGENQAYDAAYILKDVEVSKVFSSSLKRALRTAEIISEVCELELESTDQLQERGWGAFEGEDHNGNLSFLNDNNIPKDGEPYTEFENRITSSLTKIIPTVSYPLIVSHGGVFRVLANLLTKGKTLDCRNCKIFMFTPSVLDEGWDISSLEED